MRILLVIVSLLSMGTLSAQELLGQERWPDGSLKATRYSEGDRIHFITYHENGRVKEMGCFLNGRRDGVWRQYTDTGVLLTQASFSYGQRQGEWVIRNTADQVMGRLVFSGGHLARGEQYDDHGALLAHRSY